MTLQLLDSEFPYIEENFIFFFISMGSGNRVGTELSYCPASLCCMAGRYDNLIPAPFLASIDCSKILALLILCSLYSLEAIWLTLNWNQVKKRAT